MNWLQRIWYSGSIREQKREETLRGLEEKYKDTFNESMQQVEDDAWDRDIEYRAEKMLLDYNGQMLEWEIKYPTIPYYPIVLPPLRRSSVYTVYSETIAKYLHTNITELVLKRFGELLKEQKEKDLHI